MQAIDLLLLEYAYVWVIIMVFESIAGIVLNKFLEKLFFGITSENIQFSLLDGKFVLSNIGLQPDLITNLNLPIELRYSYIERVEIHIPWRQEEVNVTISMNNIYVLVSDAGANFDARNIFMRGKEAAIEGALKEFKANLERQNKKEYGFFQKLLLNWLDNINIKIECIHFRYENKAKNYSFGIKINEVSARTVNNQDQPIFFNREKTSEEYVRYLLEMDFLGVYFNSKEDYFLSNKTSAEITDEFNRMSNIHAQHIENLDYEQNVDTFNYVLTISVKTHIKKNIRVLQKLNQSQDGKYLFQCDINLNKIESMVTHEQYYDILDLFSVFTEYQRTYQQYANERHLLNFREKRAKEISDLIHKKHKKTIVVKKQKEMLTATCQRYFTWLFNHAYEEVLKRRFIKEVIKKEITVKNVKQNQDAMRIMNKIDNDKLKYWLMIALYFRKKLEEKVNVLFRTNETRINSFGQKYIDAVEHFQPFDLEEEINQMRQTSSNKFQVFLKMNISIKELTFQISKESVFGVSFNISKLKASLTVREKNYQLKISMEDFEANVFNCKKSQKLKTYVPIIRRNVVYDGSTDLLEIKYERNPLGKPFIFTEIDVQFESIEITIYPQAFKQFYKILLGDKESKPQPKTKGKRQRERGENVDQNMVRQFKLQKTIIKGKVKSPWVVLPLSTNNDMGRECWVVRLGDFFISPPEGKSQKKGQKASPEDNEQDLYYQKYKLQLKQFQLRYFSSIHFFHNWLKFDQNEKSLYKIKAFSKEKIITMIEPFSCFVDVSMQRANLPSSIRDKKHKFIGRISIDEIRVTISKFLLAKMKYRFDIFGENKQEVCDFIETRVSNIKQQNDLSGFCKVSYGQIKKLAFYCILKDNYMYFFINQHHHKYHFFVNLTEVAIRIVSNQIEHFNQDKQDLIVFYLGERQKHQHWRKKIIHMINRKYRRIDHGLASSLRRSSRDTVIEEKNKNQLLQSASIPFRSPGSFRDDKEEEEVAETGMPFSLTFLMNKLSICLLDEKDQAFLDCMFKKATFTYQVLRSKEMQFSLNEWIVNQTDKKEVFASSHSFFEEEGEHESNFNLTNFLETKFIYNEITAELQTIVIEVDKLFLAWKVQLFTKILLYFFFQQEVGDTPSPMTLDKKRLQIIIRFQQFTFYAYFNEELIALGKFQYISLRYYQDSIEESYDLRCKIFEMDKYVNGDLSKRLPMIKRRLQSETSEVGYNNLDLYYVLRKKETEEIVNIQRLKKRMGEETLVSQIFCDWKDSIVYFQNEMTFRLLNYILGKILGTVTSKFKKRQYSPNYIFEAMKVKKVSAFDVKLHNFQFRMPPHERGFREFGVEMDLMRVKKNLDDVFLPTEVEVPTIRNPLIFLWESMIFSIDNVRVSYKVGQEPPIQMHQSPFDINFIYSKLNFQREYFVILKHHDDIDRKATIDLIIQKPVILDAHKIMFVTFLQLFYQNIKHKDGLAQKFQPSLPFPSLRVYKLHLQKVGFNMCHYHQQSNRMERYSINTVDMLKIEYSQVGSKSQISIVGQSILSEGELPIYPLGDQKKFTLSMLSEEGEMKVVINAEHYALEVNLDNLNNVIQFINYDSEYVSNKLMPKKTTPSWQYVNVFAKHCKLKLGDLYGEGQFYISYLKGMRNDVEKEALKYLLTEEEYAEVEADPSHLNWEGLTDKEIKVNGDNIRLSIRGDIIGGVSNLCFNRQDITSKSTNRRFKREKVQLGQGSLHIQLVDLTTIWGVYNSHIKKQSNFILKNFYEPWDKLPAKEKTIQKRATQVQIQRLSISIIPNLQIDRLMYVRVDLSFPLIVYRTYLDEQEVVVNIKAAIHHCKEKMRQSEIGSCRSFKLRYLNYKDRKEKSIEILSAKNLHFLLHEINTSVLASIIEEAKLLKETKRRCITYDCETKEELSYELVVTNETSKKIEVSVGDKKVQCLAFEVKTEKWNLQEVLEVFNRPQSFIEIREDGGESIRKRCDEINIYDNTAFGHNLLAMAPETRKLNLIYRSPFTLVNRTSGTVVMRIDRKTLKSEEKHSLVPRSSLIEFDLKVGEWTKYCAIDIRKESQIFGQQCFVATISKKYADTVIVLEDRYTLKNVLPVPITIREKQLPINGDLSLGYISPQQIGKFPIELDDYIILVNLQKKEEKVRYEQKLQENSKKKQYQIGKCQLSFSYCTVNAKTTVSIFSEYGLKNQCEKQVVFGWGSGEFVLRGKVGLILPGSFSNLTFLEEESTILAESKSKDKAFYGKYHQFKTVTRMQGKANIIKIQPKFSLLNNSPEILQILMSKNTKSVINPSQLKELTSEVIHEDKITLIFGRYHAKEILLTLFGVNYLQMEELYFRVAVIQKEESILVILEESNKSHLIVNRLKDITITACTSVEPHRLASNNSRNVVESGSEEVIMKLIRAGEEAEIGLTSWSNQLIELQFYYDAKNIEFKQRFYLDFQQLDSKYSVKHILHEEKDVSVICSIILTFEKDKEGRFTISAHKEKDYECTALERMKFGIHQVSCTFVFSGQTGHQITLECYKLNVIREKGAEIQDFDVQVGKLLIREGKYTSILNALGQGKFLNCHLILNKTLRGTYINNLILKLTPFELICREKSIFMVLEKIVEVRAGSSSKKKNLKLARQSLNDDCGQKEKYLWKSLELGGQMSDLQPGGFSMLNRETKTAGDGRMLEKQWQKQLQKLVKGQNMMIVNNLQSSQTSIFISYTKEEYRSFDEKIANDPIIKYMLVIPPISELKLAIPHLKITDFEGDPKAFSKELISRLRQSIGATIMSSFSSLPLFDSPIIAADGIFKYIEGVLSIQ